MIKKKRFSKILFMIRFNCYSIKIRELSVTIRFTTAKAISQILTRLIFLLKKRNVIIYTYKVKDKRCFIVKT